MKSIFSEISLNRSGSETFWEGLSRETFSRIKKNSLLSSYLCTYISEKYIRKKFVLTSDSIYYINFQNIPFSQAYIKLALLEVLETTKNRYGFRISNEGGSQEFFTRDQEIFQSWLSALHEVCVFSGFEENFSLVKELGIGNTAIVYLYQGQGSHYAVKSISKQNLASLSSIERLAHEIEVLRSLSHPNITKLHSVYQTEESVNLVLDYASGSDYYEKIMNLGAVSETEAVKFMYQLLLTLDYIHSQKVIHRDVKLENILVNHENSSISLTDFGLACFKQVGCIERCGSPGYVAPEILRGLNYDCKVDLFSAGIVMYSILTSRSPFQGGSPDEVLLKNKNCQIKFPEKYWGKVSKLGVDLAKRLVCDDPRKRPSAEEALRHPWFSGFLAIPHYVRTKKRQKVKSKTILPRKPLESPFSKTMKLVFKCGLVD